MNILYRPKPLKSPRKITITQLLPKLNRIKTSKPSYKPMSHHASVSDLISPSSDRVFMSELECKVENQRKDLEERSLALESLASHFESIVKSYKDEKLKYKEMKERCLELRNENLEMKIWIDENKLKYNQTIELVKEEEMEGKLENEELKENCQRLIKRLEEMRTEMEENVRNN